MTSPREPQLLAAFVRAADTLVDDYDVAELLQQLLEDCVDLLGVTAAGLLLVDQRGGASIVATTSAAAHDLERVQVAAGRGPSLDAIATGRAVAVPDVAASASSWPELAARAAADGVRAVHALPLRLRDQVIGGLTLLQQAEQPVRPGDLAVAQALADVATIGVLHHRVAVRHETLGEQLQTALRSRVVIEQAKGVLAERRGTGTEEAFEVLRGRARHSRRRLLDVAREVVDGGGDETTTRG
ncbi:GAF and ANTAR domain-containing protein [Rhodococcus aerolatus]